MSCSRLQGPSPRSSFGSARWLWPLNRMDGQRTRSFGAHLVFIEQRPQSGGHSFRRCQLGGGDVLAAIGVQGLDDDAVVCPSEQPAGFLMFELRVSVDADSILVALFGS